MVTRRATEEVETDDELETEPDEQTLTTINNIMGRREIVVDDIEEVAPSPPDHQGMVVIRMNETLDAFTYGDPKKPLKMEYGKQYRVPAEIANYLDGLGYVWH